MSHETQNRQPIAIEKVGIPIPEDQVTLEMRMNAIGSPERKGAGILRTSEINTKNTSTVEVIGETVTSSQVELDESEIINPSILSVEQNNPYDKLFETSIDSENSTEPKDFAIKSTEGDIPSQTSNRTGYWKPSTPEQITQGNKNGLDLAAHNAKYYPYTASKNK